MTIYSLRKAKEQERSTKEFFVIPEGDLLFNIQKALTN